jgi:hypothetical protein
MRYRNPFNGNDSEDTEEGNMRILMYAYRQAIMDEEH